MGCDRLGNPLDFGGSVISIHAPRVGCDRAAAGLSVEEYQFQSTHPVWGATPLPCGPWWPWAKFQSTHPVWGATWRAAGTVITRLHFNPRTPCGVRPRCPNRKIHQAYFNPRTPCGVRPVSIHQTCTPCRYFNPRTPCGVRLPVRCYCELCGHISIHAPRVGCDRRGWQSPPDPPDFNPRTPCGVRL